MHEKEKQLTDAKNKFDEQVAGQVEEQLKKNRTRITAEEAKKAKWCNMLSVRWLGQWHHSKLLPPAPL